MDLETRGHGEVVRLRSLLSLVLFTGCASAPAQSPTPKVRVGSPAEGHALEALALQEALASRPTSALLEEHASDQVLELAHAQTCLARYTRSEALAAETIAMLDDYAELHELHGSEPERRFRRRARQLSRDAENAGRGIATPYALGCTMVDSSVFSHRRFTVSARRPPDTDSIPWGVYTQSMQGGVVR